MHPNIQLRISLTGWTVHTWPAVQVPLLTNLALEFEHLRTIVAPPGDRLPATLASGHSLWYAQNGKFPIGLGFSWAVLGCSKMLVLADALGVVTNLQLLDPYGNEMGTETSAKYLVPLVRTLDWERVVNREANLNLDYL